MHNLRFVNRPFKNNPTRLAARKGGLLVVAINYKLSHKHRPVFSTNLKDVEVEIQSLVRTFREAERNTVFEIGKRLKHVKDNDLTHGQWLPWLRKIGLKDRTAQRYIQAYEEFGNTSAATHLSWGKIQEMLSLPRQVDRTDFISKIHTVPKTGEKKTVSEMTTDEVRDIVKAERMKAGLIKGSGGRKINQVASGPTPYVTRLIKSLSNLTEPVARMLEDGEITVSDAMKIGEELNRVQQRTLHEILIDYGYEASWAVDAVKAGLTKDIAENIDRLYQRADECEVKYESIPYVRAGLALIRSDFTRIFDKSTSLKEINGLLQSIGERLEELEERGKEERRKEETRRWSHQFGFAPSIEEAFRKMDLEVGASHLEVKRKWRELAMKYHPDKIETGNEQKFKEIKQAYDDIATYFRMSAG